MTATSGFATVYVLLGSNLGDRATFLSNAMELIGELPNTTVNAQSKVRETAPVEMTNDAPTFLNQAVEMRTTLPPDELLHQLQLIERRLGRTSGKGKRENRTIDLDILLYDDLIYATDTLVIPHPALLERTFALEPLVELAGEALHPITRKPLSWHLCALIGQHSGVRREHEAAPHS